PPAGRRPFLPPGDRSRVLQRGPVLELRSGAASGRAPEGSVLDFRQGPVGPEEPPGDPSGAAAYGLAPSPRAVLPGAWEPGQHRARKALAPRRPARSPAQAGVGDGGLGRRLVPEHGAHLANHLADVER